MKTFVKRNPARSGLSLIMAIVFGGVYLLSVIYPSDDFWNNNPLMFLVWLLFVMGMIWGIMKEGGNSHNE